MSLEMNPETQVIRKLKASQSWLITVESCTGGLIAHRMTQIAGASEVFWGGFVTYHNSSKELLAKVPRELMIRHGAVSPEVAAALADGGLAVLSDTMQSTGNETPRACLATTGIAGPGGGTEDKPVGLCYVGVAISGQPTQVHEIRGPIGLTRDEYKKLFADTALNQLVRQLP
jgi:PncC family amidohydrolase